MEQIDYQKQAQDFLEKTGSTFESLFLYHGLYFEDDKESRDVYQITLKRNGKEYRFKFGQSIAHSGGAYNETRLKKIEQHYGHFSKEARAFKNTRKAPTPYDVLAGVQKYDVGTFKDFCGDFGYSEDSIKAQKVYFAVQEEAQQIQSLFHDVMEQLQEIN